VIAQCSYEARSEAVCYRLTVEFASNEDDLAAARLIRFPEPIRAAVHQHMHALQDDAPVLARDRRALRRAGLDLEFKGAHLLRHSLATNLVRHGATLGEIGQLLVTQIVQTRPSGVVGTA
jgi:hypothetical protein